MMMKELHVLPASVGEASEHSVTVAVEPDPPACACENRAIRGQRTRRNASSTVGGWDAHG